MTYHLCTVIDVTPADCPRISKIRIVPVAGRDSMLLNLSGAHAPFFTRNLAIVTARCTARVGRCGSLEQARGQFAGA